MPRLRVEAMNLPDLCPTCGGGMDWTYKLAKCRGECEAIWSEADFIAPRPADQQAIIEALGFDPTNHHNAATCPYCTPHPDDEAAEAWKARAIAAEAKLAELERGEYICKQCLHRGFLMSDRLLRQLLDWRDYEYCEGEQPHELLTNAVEYANDLLTTANTYKAKVAALDTAIAELSEKWRMLKNDEQCHSLMPIAQICEGCADELEALLREEGK